MGLYKTVSSADPLIARSSHAGSLQCPRRVLRLSPVCLRHSWCRHKAQAAGYFGLQRYHEFGQTQGLATGWSSSPEVKRPECEALDVPVCCHIFDSRRGQLYAPTAPVEDLFWGPSMIFGEWSGRGATVATHLLVTSNVSNDWSSTSTRRRRSGLFCPHFTFRASEISNIPVYIRSNTRHFMSCHVTSRHVTPLHILAIAQAHIGAVQGHKPLLLSARLVLVWRDPDRSDNSSRVIWTLPETGRRVQMNWGLVACTKGAPGASPWPWRAVGQIFFCFQNKHGLFSVVFVMEIHLDRILLGT